MTTKKTNANLKKLISETEFDVKANAGGVEIAGFANKATIDRGDELIATDAWKLDNFKKNPIILFNHGMDSLGGTPVGKATEVRPTDEGLFLKVKLSNSKAPGIQMVRDLVEERILKAFSVGFNPIKSENVDMDGKSVKKITEAELFEVSIVGIPMNQDSLFELAEKGQTFHQVKSLILKTKKADDAVRAEDFIAASGKDRKDLIIEACKATEIKVDDALAMLAGDKDMDEKLMKFLAVAVVKKDLKEDLEAALAKLDEGESPEAVAAELAEKLKPSEEPKMEDDEDEEKEGEDEKARKQDFQDCVSAKIPALLQEGMEQDQAVAVAIAKCQEEGKCALTPEAKSAVFAECFTAIDASAEIDLLNVIEFAEKQVEQEDQPPTTPIKTEPSVEDFGNPHLEAAKQTNILLGALINEIQKLSSNISGLANQNQVQSEDSQPKESAEAAEETATPEDNAKKRLEYLSQRLKNLGY